MYGPVRQRIDGGACLLGWDEHGVANCLVIGERSDRDFDSAHSSGRRVRNARALFSHAVRLRAGSVVDGEFVSSADQVERHRLAHISETDKRDFQVDAPSKEDARRAADDSRIPAATSRYIGRDLVGSVWA